MKTLKLPIVAFAAVTLTGCSFGASNDEPLTTASAPVASTATSPASNSVTNPVTNPVPSPETATASPTPAANTASATQALPEQAVQTFNAHIDASAFLNALVESGCQIDKAEYKEVKRGGAIKVVCSKSIDALNVELEDL